MRLHRKMAEEVSAAIDGFAHLVSSDVPAPMDDLSRARLILVQSVNKYVSYFSQCLAAVASHSDLEAWKEEFERVCELRRTYSEHIARYSASLIQAHWSDYTMNCHRLIQGMNRHLRYVQSLKAID